MSYFKLKHVLWLAIILLAGCKQQVQDVEVGRGFVCAQHDNSVSCWGIWSSNFFSNVADRDFVRFQTNAEYVDPKLAVGNYHYCVLDQSQVECHLNNEKGQGDVPALSNPYEIAAGMNHTCALDDSGVVCWGEFLDFLHPIPDNLENPRNLVSGVGHICVNDDNGVHCAGVSLFGELDPRPTESINVDSLLVSSTVSPSTCAYDNEWICWGGDLSFDPPAGAADFDIVKPSYRQICGATSTEVTCWGEDLFIPRDFPESFSGITDIAIGYGASIVCVNSDAGLQCWGGAVPVPLYL